MKVRHTQVAFRHDPWFVLRPSATFVRISGTPITVPGSFVTR
jgi:hypothetical protein